MLCLCKRRVQSSYRYTFQARLPLLQGRRSEKSGGLTLRSTRREKTPIVFHNRLHSNVEFSVLHIALKPPLCNKPPLFRVFAPRNRDNNILACEYGINQLASLIGSGYRIDLYSPLPYVAVSHCRIVIADRRMRVVKRGYQVSAYVADVTCVGFIRARCSALLPKIPIYPQIQLRVEQDTACFRVCRQL